MPEHRNSSAKSLRLAGLILPMVLVSCRSTGERQGATELQPMEEVLHTIEFASQRDGDPPQTLNPLELAVMDLVHRSGLPTAAIELREIDRVRPGDQPEECLRLDSNILMTAAPGLLVVLEAYGQSYTYVVDAEQFLAFCPALTKIESQASTDVAPFHEEYSAPQSGEAREAESEPGHPEVPSNRAGPVPVDVSGLPSPEENTCRFCAEGQTLP